MKTVQQTTDMLTERLATEEAISAVKSAFETYIKKELSLFKISAPMIVLKGTGVNDDLNGTERAVQFPVKGMGEQPAEVVQSLAKWKRLQLKEHNFPAGTGILTNMKALRADEDLSPIHSVYVDQWDWEISIAPEQRELDFLKKTVQRIYKAIRATEKVIAEAYPEKFTILPDEITFIHAEDLLQQYPEKSPKERENLAAKKFGAIFIIGIGGKLSNGKPHDGRAPDYDDWSTASEKGYLGLNGDIIFWNPVLEQGFEISSMGIRVDAKALKKQLEISGQQHRKQLFYHKSLLNNELFPSIGGGIGQSRLCMFLLKKQHIGEVQVSIWPEALREECKAQGICLL